MVGPRGPILKLNGLASDEYDTSLIPITSPGMLNIICSSPWLTSQAMVKLEFQVQSFSTDPRSFGRSVGRWCILSEHLCHI